MAKFNTGQSFADGDTVTGAKLNNIVGLLDIYSGVIADQTAIAATVSTADLLLIADTDAGSSGAANKVTIQKLLNDTLTGGTFTNANIAEQLTYGTATGNRTISTSAVITNGTISNATLGTTTGTLATITNLTAGTTTSTAANITNGTVQTLTASTATISVGTYSGLINNSTGTFSGSINSTLGTIATLNSTTGTIGNFTTTLTGDLTISTGSATVGTRVAVLNTAQQYSRAHNFAATALTITGGTVPWNLAENQVATLTVTTNSTMNTPTNPQAGCTYVLIVTQGTGGNNTLSFSTAYKFTGGVAPVLSTGSAQVDVLSFVTNGTVLYGVSSQNFS
jgi:hypothetical protein